MGTTGSDVKRIQAGFTLIELMVVMAIAAILISLAAPSFARLIRSTSVASDVNTFLADLRFARNEAIKRGTVIVMCKSNAPEATTPACSTGTDWKTGWIIFVDDNNSGTYSSDEFLLRQQSALTSSGGITDASGSDTLFNFVSTGRLRAFTSTTKFTFKANVVDTSLERVVCINASGRARIANGLTSCGTDE